MEAIWTRYIPFMVKVRELLAAGAIGEVKLVEATFGFKADPSVRRLFEPALAGGALLDIGIYPVQLASMVFGPDPPIDILTAGTLTESGVDEHLSIIFKYKNGGLATISCSLAADLTNEATITGTKGRIKLHGPYWHCTEKITVTISGGKTEDLHFPIDSEKKTYNFHNSAALKHEALEVHRCLEKGLLESEVMRVEESLNLAKTMDKVRQVLGVVYPTERSS